MTLDRDELAGVVDLFGALTRAELERALDELAFKEGREVDDEALADAVPAAEEAYALVGVDRADEELLVVGPAAFPTLPDHAEDLPHIMDVPDRSVDREAVADGVVARLEREADEAVADGDPERAATLLDVSYDLEAWADVDLADVRRRLDEVA